MIGSHETLKNILSVSLNYSKYKNKLNSDKYLERREYISICYSAT
jgi:hypothetical protein